MSFVRLVARDIRITLSGLKEEPQTSDILPNVLLRDELWVSARYKGDNKVSAAVVYSNKAKSKTTRQSL